MSCSLSQGYSNLQVDFTREIVYTMWLENVLMVKKSHVKWRMFVDYTI